MKKTSEATLRNFRLETPLGAMRAVFNEGSLIALDFKESSGRPGTAGSSHPFDALEEQLRHYFSESTEGFDIPMEPGGTSFQRSVWQELRKIPIGTTRTYKELALRLGGVSNARAVASAIARNPILILIPCHRVIGSDGGLTGFSGGLERKRALLSLEGWLSPRSPFQIPLFE